MFVFKKSKGPARPALPKPTVKKAEAPVVVEKTQKVKKSSPRKPKAEPVEVENNEIKSEE